ncbi:MAG: hypothetical protein ACRD4E_01795 [Bryobacteraceae bacterium]
MQQSLGSVERLICGSGVGTVDGLLSLIQRRLDSQAEGGNLGMQGQPALVQIRLNGIRGAKIRDGAGSQQPKPPLGVFLRLSARWSGSRNPGTGSVLRRDYAQRQEQTRQAFYCRAHTSSQPEVYHLPCVAENEFAVSVERGWALVKV